MMHSLAAHGISADMVVGSSVGALNGAFYAGDPTLKGVEKLGDTCRGLARHGVFYAGDPTLKGVEKLGDMRRGLALQDVGPISWRTVLSFLWRRDFLISH